MKLPRYTIEPPKFVFHFQPPQFTPPPVPRPTLKQTEHFYDNKHRIIPTILSVTDPHEVIHGERAVQRYIPKRLHRPTTDIDIFTDTPRKDALEAEKKLDHVFGADIFYTEQGQHEGTWRVKSRTNNQAYVDYTRPDTEMPPHRRIGRHNYVTQSYIQTHNKSILRDPDASYRHAKDKDTLNRLTIGRRKK